MIKKIIKSAWSSRVQNQRLMMLHVPYILCLYKNHTSATSRSILLSNSVERRGCIHPNLWSALSLQGYLTSLPITCQQRVRLSNTPGIAIQNQSPMKSSFVGRLIGHTHTPSSCSLAGESYTLCRTQSCLTNHISVSTARMSGDQVWLTQKQVLSYLNF